MGITFSGLSSGLDTDAMIRAIITSEGASLDVYKQRLYDFEDQKDAIDSVESKYLSFKNSVETITDSSILSSTNLFNQKLASSSDSDIITATSSSTALTQSIDVKVEQLATSTVARTQTDFSDNINGSEEFTTLANNEGKEGIFSIYVNGVLHEIEIGDTEDEIDAADEINTLDEIAAELQKIDGISNAGVVNGKFQIETDGTVTNLKFGSSTDTSNFYNVMNLSAVDLSNPTSATIESSDEVNKINTEGTIMAGADSAGLLQEGAITEGSFTIGNEVFTIDSSTKLNDLINEINSRQEAGVVASIDNRTNQLVFTSTEPGNTAIKFADGDDDPETTDSNFLSAIGFIDGTGNSLSCQEFGKNTIVYLNDSTDPIEATSSKLTGDVTGLTGVTLNILKLEPDDKPVTITISNDTSELENVLDKFISTYNDLVAEIAYYTDQGKALDSEFTLNTMKNTLRSTVSNRIEGISSISSFYDIGISTGEAGESISDLSASLTFDKSKLIEALEANPSDVEKLLLGDENKGIKGIFETLDEIAESTTDFENGYFAAKDDSLEASIKSVNDTIERTQARLDEREAQLKMQFTAMETQMNSMNQQSAALSAL